MNQKKRYLPPYTEQEAEAVKCIYTPITFTSQRDVKGKRKGEKVDP